MELTSTPEKLREMSHTFTAQARALTGELATLDRAITELSQSWQGEAQVAALAMYNRVRAQLQAQVASLTHAAAALDHLAGAYARVDAAGAKLIPHEG
ncbi:WXG100 family type VII secretion target [Mycetocola lacteus]|uniref:ESAT-6-like protein n=1 Tax=Mycetocola lacteus TaxID=76637 RepID=A0A3L7ATS9_9MICO|nr:MULTISPECIES: WXG100 family type VII secretion target [Mycetocola]RLP82940.1 WXG100 family type VII secretion target [Mycetocola lacteus]